MQMLDDGVAKLEAMPDFTSEMEASFAQARENLANLMSNSRKP